MIVNQDEREANAFAMELLMPEELIRDCLDDLLADKKNDDAILKTLARKFDVSQSLMACRLIDLGLLISP